MKKFIFILLLGCASISWGQTDTLYEENLRKAADLLFQNLDSSLYGPSLLNRSFSDNPVIREQLLGNYRQTHTLVEFLFMYQDLAWAYADSTYMMNIDEMVVYIDSLFYEYEMSDDVDEDNDDLLVLPFGLILHNTSYIDSAKWNEENFEAVDFTYRVLTDEREIYTQTKLKSCGVLEFYSESGYEFGYLKYEPRLISHSPDVSNLTLRIDCGNGFKDFNAQNSLLKYSRERDSVIGKVAIRYNRNNELFYDTMDFYLTTRSDYDASLKSSNKGWDIKGSTFEVSSSGVKIKYAVKWGCGNSKKVFRRPIIIIPPYRPRVQSFSLNKYYNQFNYKSVIDILADMGYDVIFVKLKPGNNSLEDAAEVVRYFILYINNQKGQAYPNEAWENIVMGYSMGGQIARYALKKMEYEHMENRAPHHHTRLYIPFDSPHLGANIPMFTQFVYYDMKGLNFFAKQSYKALIDEASKDMGICHISACPMSESNINYQNINSNTVWSMKAKTYTPAHTSERLSFLNDLNNMYHQFTPFDDLRKTYPTFTRNVAVSVGGNTNNYNDEYQLGRGKLIYSQDKIVFQIYGGFKYRYRQVYASKYDNNAISFVNRMENRSLLIPIVIRKNVYRLNYGYEWDMAQGGYKDEFWDKNGPFLGMNIIPVGVVPLLNTWGMVNTDNNKLYFDHMGFLPMLSSLHINPNLWYISEQFPNGNLKFNLKNEGLMYSGKTAAGQLILSNTYGYPNLGHPSNHFNITPFEAIYCDHQTYEHIKMQASITPNSGLDDVFLVHTRNFVVNEVESDVVYLQNKTIGLNHVQGVPSYKYRAWYKAYTRIEIGNLVTPQTDPGDYVIEATGDITVYAGESVILKPGFHAQNGSTFHAFIKQECAQPPANVPVYALHQEPESLPFTESTLAEKADYSIEQSSAEKNNEPAEDLERLNLTKNTALLEENLPNKPPQTETIRLFAVRNDDDL